MTGLVLTRSGRRIWFGCSKKNIERQLADIDEASGVIVPAAPKDERGMFGQMFDEASILLPLMRNIDRT
jgi:hypothetical protein